MLSLDRVRGFVAGRDEVAVEADQQGILYVGVVWQVNQATSLRSFGGEHWEWHN